MFVSDTSQQIIAAGEKSDREILGALEWLTQRFTDVSAGIAHNDLEREIVSSAATSPRVTVAVTKLANGMTTIKERHATGTLKYFPWPFWVDAQKNGGLLPNTITELRREIEG